MADGRFRLLGRLDRIVKIEEKRLSLPDMSRGCSPTPGRFGRRRRVERASSEYGAVVCTQCPRQSSAASVRQTRRRADAAHASRRPLRRGAAAAPLALSRPVADQRARQGRRCRVGGAVHLPDVVPEQRCCQKSPPSTLPGGTGITSCSICMSRPTSRTSPVISPAQPSCRCCQVDWAVFFARRH